MRRATLDLLECPHCRSDKPLEISIDRQTDDGDIVEGQLLCTGCAASYAITNSVPRFVSADEDYCGNFGFQWQHWKDIQIDRLSGHTLSADRFFQDSRWSRDWLKGKLILDAGCGAGRFTDVAASHGATVMACDLSDAIDACRAVTKDHGDRVECLQASILDLPFRKGVFDAVYCMGVIQHTPDPKTVMSSLPAYLKPGGRLAYNFYEEGFWRRLQLIKYALRLITPRLPINWTLSLSRGMVRLLFPVTAALAPIRKIRILNHFMPISGVHYPVLSREQQYTWTLLDTFDWYAPRYELRQHHMEVRALLDSQGLQDVDSQPGLAWGSAPDP